MTASGVPAATPPRGRTRVTAHALNRVVSAVAAETFGVHRKHVAVELRDDGGTLAPSISTRVPITVPQSGTDATRVHDPSGGTLLERSERAEQVIRDRVALLTGSSVGRITIHFTGTTTRSGGRVR